MAIPECVSVFLYGYGVCRQVVKASGCDSDMRGFESHQAPQLKIGDKAQSVIDICEVSHL